MKTINRQYSVLDARMPAGNMNGWQDRHHDAIRSPRGPEVAIVGLLRAWCEYANRHRERFESGIGEDYVLGPEWARIGIAVRGLLNGESGRLDCGTLDGFILDVLQAEGYDEEGDRDAREGR